jgi:toxin FitB
MIILDTNVLSTLMNSRPDVAVVTWLDRQPTESIWITSITVFESRLGLALLPDGRRRQLLEAAFEQIVAVDLDDRVLVS